MWYNYSCQAEQNSTRALCVLSAASPIIGYYGQSALRDRTSVLAVQLGSGSNRGGRFVVKERSWKAKVYGKTHVESGLPEGEWRKLRNAILYRDRQICLRCDKRHRAKNKLSVHHLLPRANGGSNDPSNLVTLCHRCHDYVEIKGLRTEAEIIGSFDAPGVVIIKVEEVEEKPDPYNRPEWHKYVYGGKRK